MTAFIGVCITISLASRHKEKEKFQKANEDYVERMNIYKERMAKQRELKLINDNKIEILTRQIDTIKKKEIVTNNRIKVIYEKILYILNIKIIFQYVHFWNILNRVDFLHYRMHITIMKLKCV